MTPATRVAPNASRLGVGLRLLGAAALLVDGAVHVQQYVQIFNGVRWIGPLFVLNAVGCAVVASGLMVRRAARLAAAAGVIISVAALAALAKSFDGGILGWAESTLRPAIWITIVSEAVSAVALGALLVLMRVPRARCPTVGPPAGAPAAADPRPAR